MANSPEAQDEYDAYVLEIQGLLSRGASVTELFDALWRTETVHMGLTGNREKTGRVAERLRTLVQK